MKVGGSTAVSVNIRIAKSVAGRKVQALWQRQQSHGGQTLTGLVDATAGAVSDVESMGEKTTENASRTAINGTEFTDPAVIAKRKAMLAFPTKENASDTDPDAYLVPQRDPHIHANAHFIPLCQTRFDHGTGLAMKYRQRIRTKSFLWGIVRDPIARWVSEFFHFAVSRQRIQPYDRHFIDYLNASYYQHNYLVTAMTTRRYAPNVMFAVLANSSDPERLGVQMVNDILADYDFIAVTERMTESVVVLQMLLDLPTSDILFFGNSKQHGSYDALCQFIVPSFVSPGMKAYFDGPVMAPRIRFEQLLHQAANRSLDLTIDALGRAAFQTKLQRYMWAQQLVKSQCHNATVRCNSNGEFAPQANSCIWNDSGCGMDCIDAVVARYKLDE